MHQRLQRSCLPTARALALLLFGAVAMPAALGAASSEQFRLAPGLTIHQFAGPELATNIYTLALDPHGHPTVSGPGYIKILVDLDGDGRADRADRFADGPADGAQGLLWDGKVLYVTGAGGIWRYVDGNGDHRPDGPPQRLLQLKTGGEHDAHAICRGPDGWFYIVCGNHTGVTEKLVSSACSAVQRPIAGVILRVDPSWQKVEVFAHGFRNPYDIAFNSDGELFTYDSDNERCVGLPWYEPTRLYHVVPGGFYGWLSPQKGQFWRFPPWFPDVVPPVAYLGRGSPTGVVSARGLRFPKLSPRDLLVADWTFGRIIHVGLQPAGASYRSQTRVLVAAEGTAGFAPTDLAVDRGHGVLWITTGGRGTRGAVYVLRAQRQTDAPDTPPSTGPPLMPLYRRLVRGQERPNDVRAACETGDRLVLQALVRRGTLDLTRVSDAPAAELVKLMVLARTEPQRALERLAQELAERRPAWQKVWLLRAAQVAIGDVDPTAQAGTVWEGYTASVQNRQPSGRMIRVVTALLRSAEQAVRWEAGRCLALMGRRAGVAAARELLQAARNGGSAVETEHFLIAFAQVTAGGAWAAQVADLLINLPYRLDHEGRERDRHWPLRMGELYARLAQQAPGLHRQLIAHPRLGHPAHEAYLRVRGFPLEAAVRRYWAMWQQGKLKNWPAVLVPPLAGLERGPWKALVRELWEAQPELRGELLRAMARRWEAEFRPWIEEGVGHHRLDVALACVQALRARGLEPGPRTLAAGARLWQRLLSAGQSQRARLVADWLAERLGKKLASPAEAMRQIRKRWPEATGHAGTANWDAWRRRLRQIDWSQGKAERGRRLFGRLGCSRCHTGPSMVGPDLRGVARRFSRKDLFRAIVLPDEVVPDRYAATLFLLRDGRVVRGVVVYEAAQVVMVQTAEAELIRIEPDEVQQRARLAGSIMPTGLLHGLSDTDLADLYAYLRSL